MISGILETGRTQGSDERDKANAARLGEAWAAYLAVTRPLPGQVATGDRLTIEFQDGRVAVTADETRRPGRPKVAAAKRAERVGQGDLF